MKKLLLMTSALGLLAACGGSSSGGAVNPTTPPPSATVLRSFTDGSGVARAEYTEDGVNYVANVIGPDIANYLPTPGGVVDSSDVQLSGSNQYGNFYTGQASVNGVVVDVLIYQDNTGQVEAGYAETSGFNAAYAGGQRVSNIPAGSHTYAGTNIIGARDGSYFESGTFAMNVDFSNGTAAITGSTPTSSIGGSNIAVNTSNGTFTGNNLTLTDTLNNVSFGANIDGNFHGNGATGVTGIYTDSGSNPVVAGAIAGTRQ